MRLPIRLWCVLLPLLQACCPETRCDVSFASTVLTGFSPQELDSVRIVITDMDGEYGPDTVYSAVVFYDDTSASPEMLIPFNKRNSYEYYLPKIRRRYLVDGYDVSKEGCGDCILSPGSGSYYDVLRAYRVNGLRYEGDHFVIRK